MRQSADGYFRQRTFNHLLFWVCCTAFLTFLFSVGLDDNFLALKLVLMLLPVHIIYYYSLRSFIIPRFLYTRQFLKLVVSFLIVCVFCLALYRSIEVFFADPYLNKHLVDLNPDFKWKKLQGSISEQLLNPQYLIAALEQSNSVVWVALVVKFVLMWHERKQVALNAELSFLKSQIHPHFLFNTLNNLYALTLNKSSGAPKVVLGLSEILRYMLYECNASLVPLKRDVEIIQSYLALEKLRYEDRLDLNFSIKGDISTRQIAPLLMLPLVENAFKHGASEMTEGAWINVDLELSESALKFKVANGKPLSSGESKRSAYKTIGITNLKKRLELIYPDRHTFTIFNEEDVHVAIIEIHGFSPNPAAPQKVMEQHAFAFQQPLVQKSSESI